MNPVTPRHLVISYHTCPLEEPGTALAGGMNIYLRGLLPALAARGWNIDVLARGERDEELSMAGGPGSGIRILRVGVGDANWDRRQARECLDEFCAKARQALGSQLTEAYRSVSAHYWLSGMAARQLCPQLPLALTYHTIQAAKGKPVGDEALERVGEENRLAAEASHVVFNSWLDRHKGIQLVPAARSKARVIRPGLSPYFGPQSRIVARDQLGRHISGRLVVMAARQDPIKRVDLALDAVRQLRSEGLPLSILVVGQTLPEEPGVFSMPSVEHRQMPWIVSAADLILCPSDYESFGLVALEAISAGVPVLVGPGGYWARIFRTLDVGRVSTSSQWVEHLRELLANPLQRARMGLRGQLLSQSFGWERAAARWERLL